MKTKAMKKILSVLLACMMLVGVLAGLNVFAAEAPTIEIVSNNMWQGETLYPMYAVATEGDTTGYEIVVKVTVNGEEYTCVEAEDTTYGTVYVAPYGVAAQNINTEYVATPYLVKGNEEIAGDAQTYSILEYLNERLYVSTGVTDAQKTMYNALIDYAVAADAVINADNPNNIGDYVYVNVKGDDALTGLYKAGDVIKATTDLVAEDGYVVVWTVTDSNDKTTKLSIDDMTNTGYTVTDKPAIIEAVIEESNEGKVETTLATFEFGEDNSSKTHTDGSALSVEEYTNNGYTLSLENTTNVYGPSFDNTGISCIKFGTSSKTGSMTFNVPDNVTKVVIYVAKYKANTSKVSINGTEYTLENNSNDGLYDEIEVDTTSVKTISFATVTGGVRAMMNTIEFIGYAE